MGKVSNPYPDQISTVDILTADATLGLTTAWTEIGRYQIPAGNAIKVGQGTMRGQDNAEGRHYCDLIDDAAGAEDGKYRVVAVNPTQTKNIILYSGTTTKGRSGDADTRAAQVPLAERGGWIPENWFLTMQMQPLAAGDVIDVSACTFLLDIMRADYAA